jgi:SAM-dependent methyltransferase
MHPLQDSINARVYQRAGIEREYQDDGLTRAEGIALLKYQPAFAGKDVLDIGVGTGRTAFYLASLARRYQAIDYSPEMVRRFEQVLPDVPVALADMREMSGFPNGAFDFVLASNNVFDAIGHEDRLHTLHEIHRLLRPGGILMFSSHNRDVRDAVHQPRLEFSRNPVTQLKFAAHWCLSLINHARLRGLQRFTDEYAIINDQAHDCALLHYYIGPEAQRRQLRERGFDLLEIFDKLGNPVPTGKHAEHSRWLLYVALRIPVS